MTMMQSNEGKGGKKSLERLKLEACWWKVEEKECVQSQLDWRACEQCAARANMFLCGAERARFDWLSPLIHCKKDEA